jgi:hypothetical protein
MMPMIDLALTVIVLAGAVIALGVDVAAIAAWVRGRWR